MKFELIDPKIKDFASYQRAIFNSLRLDYLSYCVLVAFLGAILAFYFRTQVHQLPLDTVTTLSILGFIFPGPFVFALILSSVLFTIKKKQNKAIEIKDGSISVGDTVLTAEKLLFVQFTGPHLMIVRMKGISEYFFISQDILRNQIILGHLKSIKSDLPVKRHAMGKVITG